MRTTLLIRLITAFLIVIILSLGLNTWIEYRTILSSLPRIMTEVQTDSIARFLGNAYTMEGNWDVLGNEIEWIEQDHGQIPLRIVVFDPSGIALYNSFSHLENPGTDPLIEGETRPIISGNRGEIVGTVTAYMGLSSLKNQAVEYVKDHLKRSLWFSGIAFIILLGGASLLSYRILRPVRALTISALSLSDSGEGEKLTVNGRDDLSQMAAAYNRLLDSLDVQRKLRKRLIDDVSHEIATPLNNIRLEARGMSDGLIDSDGASNHIIGYVDRLSNLVEDLNWLAETDSGQFHMRQSPAIWRDLLEEEANRWCTRAETKGVDIETHFIPGRTQEINCDRLRLGQALSNLLDNALRYTPANGKIILGGELLSDQLHIYVEDTGPGAAEEDLPHLFERFYRADTSRNGEIGGRGLGLAIASQIIRLHSGEITAENRPSGGLRITMILPIL